MLMISKNETEIEFFNELYMFSIYNYKKSWKSPPPQEEVGEDT